MFYIDTLLTKLLKSVSILFLIVLFQACTNVSNNNQTIEFRHFIRDFFESKEYQLAHVKFPLKAVYSGDAAPNHPEITKYFDKEMWEHISGPDYYRCESDCYDIVIYDNFYRSHKETNKRVLSFEGVSNGINGAFYFERIKGQWFMVKLEEFHN